MPLKSPQSKSLIAGYCVGKPQNFCSVEHLKMMNKIIEDRERERERETKTIENNERQYFERDNNNEY
jgi:hypothetical protein